MSKNYTDVATSAMQSVYGSVASAIDGMRGVHSNLGTSVPAGLNPYWDGQAHDIFEANFTAFLGRLSLYVADCESLNGNMDAARKNYEGAEGAAQSGVGAIPSDMGSIGAPPGTVINPAPKPVPIVPVPVVPAPAPQIVVGSTVQVKPTARDINTGSLIRVDYRDGGARKMTVRQIGRTVGGVYDPDYYVCYYYEGGRWVTIGGFHLADLVFKG
jgi:uncharacterized protein YukE